MCASHFGFSFVALISLLTLTLQHALQPFGVGFEFTPGYATSAISYPNGSNVALARVVGNDEWKKLMYKICLEPDSLRRRPWTTSTESTTVANMLRSLISTTETILGHRVPAAALSMPSRDEGSHYGNPVADIVREAFSLVGLEYTEIIAYSYYGEPLLYPENSIMAAHNLGLCHPYNVSSEYCLGPGRRDRLGREQYYMVGYYTDALEVILTSPTALAYGVTPYPYADYELGENMRNRNPDESFYWEQVRHLLSTPLLRHVWKPTRVVMYGDRSNDIHMQQLIKDVLKAFLAGEEQPKWVNDSVNPVFAGAMGAAEFAKREPFWKKKKPILKMAPLHKVYL